MVAIEGGVWLEHLRGRERQSRVPYFFGDTVENFLLTGYEDQGKVFIDRTRHPHYSSSEVFFERGKREFPTVKALDKALKLHHTPAIIQTDLTQLKHCASKFPGSWYSIPGDIVFPVLAVWVPVPSFDIYAVDLSLDGWRNNSTEVLNQFISLPPQRVLLTSG